MERLARWLRKRLDEGRRRVSLEEALLSGGGRFLRYARYRLVGFGLSRVLAATSHILEFTVLVGVFKSKGLVASLALQNISLVVESFWWGCLEVMRAKIRSEPEKTEIAEDVSRWLVWSLRIGFAVVALPVAIAVGDQLLGDKTPGVLHAYAIVCGLRLAIDLASRTYYSGVFALGRVYRPLFSVLLANPLGLVLVLILFPHLGVWSFPAGLLGTVIVSRGIALYYTTRMYRLVRLPLPRLRLLSRARKRTPSSTGAPQPRAVLAAGVANLSTRGGSILVLGALLWPLLQGGEPNEVVLGLQISATLLGAASFWTQVFYHDFKRLEDDAYTLLRRRLARSLLATSVLVGGVLWAMAAAAIVYFIRDWAVMSLIAALFPVFLSFSCLSALQLRDFAGGQFSRLGVVSTLVALAVGGVVLWGTHDTPTTWSVLLTTALLSGVMALWMWKGRRSGPGVGVQPTLLTWLRVVARTKGPVRIGRATTADASVTNCRVFAARIAESLAEGGAVTVIPASRRIFWFERQPAALALPALVAKGAGKLKSIDRTAYHEDGRAAVEAAVEMGLLAAVPAAASLTSRTALFDEFRARFGERAIVVDLAVARSDALARLEPAERRAVWQDGAREARLDSIARQRTGYEVLSFRPGGEIAALFLVPRTEPLEQRRSWRKLLGAANRRASTEVIANVNRENR